jgi:hypothetical protein
MFAEWLLERNLGLGMSAQMLRDQGSVLTELSLICCKVASLGVPTIFMICTS